MTLHLHGIEIYQPPEDADAHPRLDGSVIGAALVLLAGIAGVWLFILALDALTP